MNYNRLKSSLIKHKLKPKMREAVEKLQKGLKSKIRKKDIKNKFKKYIKEKRRTLMNDQRNNRHLSMMSKLKLIKMKEYGKSVRDMLKKRRTKKINSKMFKH